MPRRVWKQSEIEFAVPLAYQGYTWTEIAKMLTFEYLSGLGFSAEHLSKLEVINQDRHRDTPQAEVISRMVESLGVMGKVKVTESQLRDAIVLPYRLTRLSRTDRWATYYKAYEQSQEAEYADRVSQ